MAQFKFADSSFSDDSNTCVVCFRSAKYFSIGECDHPVCHECSTRMRVLCGRTECPICRKDMAVVVFAQKTQPFASFQYRSFQFEPRYSIYFENDDIMKAYDSLLDHRCNICEGYPLSKTFNHLKEHMKKIHERFYCELCVDNLKIFTKERRYYTRSLLAQHRRKGDTDDKSHRGHPLCEFCDVRYMDNDELFRHLRRDHFFCHFCDADGVHQYYNDYPALREHFRNGHFLCEEGDCLEERFTSAFRTKLDLQAHTAQNHGHNMSKSQARQARTVDIAFTVNHRQGHFSDRGRGKGGRGGGGRRTDDAAQQLSAATAVPPSQLVAKQQAIDINCIQDFPSLKKEGIGMLSEGDGSTGKSIAQKLAQQNRFTIRTGRGRMLNDEEFPCLSSSTSVTVSSASLGVNPSVAVPPSTSVHLSVNTKKSKSGDNSMKSGSGPNVSIQYNCGNPTFTPSYHEAMSTGATGKPHIANISHSSNITVKSSSLSNSRPKGATIIGEDFPALHSSTKSFRMEGPAATWVSNQPASTTAVTKVPEKVIIKSNPSPFQANDFPSLTPSLGSQQHMLNYSGRSSLTIPMKKVNIQKQNENEENVGLKAKKKKKPVAAKGNQYAKSNKKPLTLSNVFDNSDSDGPVEDFTRGREGEYESMAAVKSSNIRFVDSSNVSNNSKKSELQIGSLQTPPELNSDGEFPLLLSTKSKQPTRNARGFASLTNGNITAKCGQNQSNAKHESVPPGFGNKAQPTAPTWFTNTDMIFTSSLGEQFSISPSAEPKKKVQSHSEKRQNFNAGFILPPDFELRNKALIDTISDQCNGNTEKFRKFKNLADMFRSNEINGQEYYERCRHVMGKSVLHAVLPELLALLPDISKQQAVLEAYRKVDGGQGCSTCFAVCAVCQQVLISEDFSNHMTSHEQIHQEEFPTLSGLVSSYSARN